MKNFFTILILTFLLIPQNVQAILENQKISLEEAISYALKTNPQNKLKKLEISQAQNNVKSANQLKNPSIGILENIGGMAKQDPQTIGIEYTIELLKRNKRKQFAKSEVEIAKKNQLSNEFDLIYNIKNAYFIFLLKKSNLKIVKEQCELSKELLENTKNAVAKNKLPKTELIQAKISYNRALMFVNIAKSEVISAQNRFNTIMNSDNLDFDTREEELSNSYSNFLTIEPTDNSINFEKIKNYALENRNDILKVKQEVKSAQENLKVVKSKLIPDIDISSGYGYMTAHSTKDNFMGGAYIGAYLTNIPLIYQYQPEIQNAKIEIEKAQLKYEDAKIDALRDITDAWEKFSISRDNLNFYNKEILENSKDLAKEAQNSYNKKEIDLTTFLISKKMYLETMLAYQDALSDYYLSYALLLKETNVVDINNIDKL